MTTRDKAPRIPGESRPRRASGPGRARDRNVDSGSVTGRSAGRRPRGYAVATGVRREVDQIGHRAPRARCTPRQRGHGGGRSLAGRLDRLAKAVELRPQRAPLDGGNRPDEPGQRGTRSAVESSAGAHQLGDVVLAGTPPDTDSRGGVVPDRPGPCRRAGATPSAPWSSPARGWAARRAPAAVNGCPAHHSVSITARSRLPSWLIPSVSPPDRSRSTAQTGRAGSSCGPCASLVNGDLTPFGSPAAAVAEALLDAAEGQPQGRTRDVWPDQSRPGWSIAPRVRRALRPTDHRRVRHRHHGSSTPAWMTAHCTTC
jgi:hypothetical protein